MVLGHPVHMPLKDLERKVGHHIINRDINVIYGWNVRWYNTIGQILATVINECVSRK